MSIMGKVNATTHTLCVCKTHWTSDQAPPGRFGAGNNPLAFDFNGDRTLEQAHRDNNAMLLLRLHQNAFDPGQRTSFYSNAVTGLEIGPRLRRLSGTEDGLDRLEFVLRYSRGPAGDSNHVYHSRGRHDREARPLRVEPAKNIAGKQRNLNLRNAIGPDPSAFVYGQKLLKSLIPEDRRYDLFASWLYPECKPQEIG